MKNTIKAVVCAVVVLGVWGCGGGPARAPRLDAVALPGDLDVVGLVHHVGGLIVGGTARATAELGRTPLTTGPGGLVVGLDRNLNPAWGAGLGGGQVSLQALAPGPFGDVVFSARFRGAFGGGGKLIKSHGKGDCVVGRMTPEGNVRWITHLGGPGEDSCPGLVATDEAVFVAGSFTTLLVEPRLEAAGGQDGFVVKLDADGKPLAGVALGSPGEDSLVALALKGTTLAVVGRFDADFQVKYSPLNRPLDGAGGFIAAVDVELVPQWARVVGRAHCAPEAVAATVDGAWIVGGTQGGAGFVSRLDKGGNPVWRQDLSGWTAVTGVALDGSDVVVAGAGGGLALQRLGGDGALVESYRCGGGEDRATAVAVTLAGDVAYGGRLAAPAACGPAGGVAGRWAGP